jgi:hypothetical protein
MNGRAPSWKPSAVPPAPCDTCPAYELCKREMLACPAYAEYVSGGEPGIASDVPRREIYMRIYNGQYDTADIALDAAHRRTR